MKRRRDLERVLARLGWRVAGVTGGGHFKLSKPGRPIVYAAASPSCRRSRKNMLAHLRRLDRAAHDLGQLEAARQRHVANAHAR